MKAEWKGLTTAMIGEDGRQGKRRLRATYEGLVEREEDGRGQYGALNLTHEHDENGRRRQRRMFGYK